MLHAVCLQALFGQLSPDVMVLTVLYSLAGEELGDWFRLLLQAPTDTLS
jgi:hypothetical protein